MSPTIIASADALKARIGEEIHVGDWTLITQERIDRFAEATGDHTWIHVDVERAKRESPYGGTIAHGLLTLAISTCVLASIEMPWSKAGAYYGTDKLRFLAPVPAHSRIRARATLLGVKDIDKGLRISWRITTELEGHDAPVLVADTLSMQFV